MNWGKLLKIGSTIGGIAAAPFTGGTSLALPRFVPAAIAGVGALGGALENRQSARTGTTSSTNTLAPVEPPEYSPLGALLRQLAIRRLESPTGLPAGFVESGIQNINRTSDLAGQGVQNRLLGMGLSDSPIAANAVVNQDIARQGNINQLQNVTAPMLEQELQQRDFENARNIFGERRVGTTTTSTGQQIAPGSILGGGLSSAAELLAYLYGSGHFQPGAKPPVVLSGMGTAGYGRMGTAG